MKLFELTDKEFDLGDGRKLRQIRAKIDFREVKKGDLGGWIEDEASLGDDVWIYPKAFVYKKAKILGGFIHAGEFIGGTISGGIILGGTFRGGDIRGGLILRGEIHGGIMHGGNIFDGEICRGEIYGGDIYGGYIDGGTIHGGTFYGGEIYGGEIHGGTFYGGKIYGGEISGGEIYGGHIHGGNLHDGKIFGGQIYSVEIYGGEIRGGEIYGGEIWGGVIDRGNHIGFAGAGSQNRYLLAYIIDNKIVISLGCFHGTIDEFYEAVNEKHGNNEHAELYLSLRPAIEAKLNNHIK